MNERLSIRRYAIYLLQKNMVFKTWYYTKSGKLTEDINKGNWYKMFPLSPTSCMVCDSKHESYFMVGNERYNYFQDAIEPMIKKLST